MNELTFKTKRRVKRKLSEEKPTILVGKGGVSRQIIEEINRQLDKKEMVKVRVLKSALEEDTAKKIAQQVSQQTEASLVEVRGHTFMLYKRRKK